MRVLWAMGLGVGLALPLVIGGNAQGGGDDSARTTLSLALKTFHHGDPAVAARQLEAFRGGSDEVSSVEVEYLLGLAYLEAGDSKRARVALEAVAQSSFILADYAALYLGQAQYDDSDPAAAVETLSALLRDYPDTLHRKKARLMLANALAGAGRHAEASALYVDVEAEGGAEDPRESVLLRAALESEAAGTLDDALTLYLRIWRDFPTTAEADVAESRLAALEADGHRAAAARKGFGPRYYRALAMAAHGHRDEAIDELEVLRKSYPRSLPRDFELRRGYTYFRARRYKEASTILGRAARRAGTPGLEAETLFWHARAESRRGNTQSARKDYRNLYQKYPTSRWSRQGLWYSGMLSLDAHEYKQAAADFAFYSQEFPRSSKTDEALWWQAWSYYRLGWWKSADKSLRTLMERYSRSSLVRQAYYWRARIALHQGDEAKAVQLLEFVDRHWPHTYYGLMGRSLLATIHPASLAAKDTEVVEEPVEELPDDDEVFVAFDEEEAEEELPADATLAEVQNAALQDRGRLDPSAPCEETDREFHYYRKRAETLVRLGFLREGAAELGLARARTSDRACLLELARFSLDATDFHGVQYIARTHLGEELTVASLNDGDLELWHMAYPKAYKQVVEIYASQYGFSPSLLWAFMREESTFRPEVVSPVGAIGLLQIMPYTGETIAHRLGIKSFDPEKLHDPEINIGFSSWYVHGLLGRWGGNEALAIASYNAGPHAVERWMKEGAELEPDEFIEEIGYTETRRYVKRVLRSYGMYERLYGEGPPLVRMSPRMERKKLVLQTGGGDPVERETLTPDHPNYPDF